MVLMLTPEKTTWARGAINPSGGPGPGGPHIWVGPSMPVGGAREAAHGVVLPGWLWGGGLYPATPMSVPTGDETVEAPTRIPAHNGNGASTPSLGLGGREGIRTGMSRRPEAICIIASFLYYSYRRKRNETIKPSTE